MKHFNDIRVLYGRIDLEIVAAAIEAMIAEAKRELSPDRLLYVRGGGAIMAIQYYKDLVGDTTLQSPFLAGIGRPVDLQESIYFANEAQRNLRLERTENPEGRPMPTAISQVDSTMRGGAIWAELGGNAESVKDSKVISEFYTGVSCGVPVVDEATAYVLSKMLGLKVASGYENEWIPRATYHLRNSVMSVL